MARAPLALPCASALLVATALGCARDLAPQAQAPAAAAPAVAAPAVAEPAVAAPTAAEPAVAAPTAAAPATATQPTLVAPTPGESIETTIFRQLREAELRGERLLVYVGAEWCAPCKAFHAEVAAGRLAAALPRLRLLELDHDRDGEALRALGYRWQFVPLFARPGPDGRPTGRQFGGVPKEVVGAPVPHLVRRIEALLADER